VVHSVADRDLRVDERIGLCAGVAAGRDRREPNALQRVLSRRAKARPSSRSTVPKNSRGVRTEARPRPIETITAPVRKTREERHMRCAQRRFALRAGDSFAHALDNTTVSAWARRASLLHARSYGRGAPLPTLPSDRHTSRVRKVLASSAPSMPPLTQNENQGQRREARRLYRQTRRAD